MSLRRRGASLRERALDRESPLRWLDRLLILAVLGLMPVTGLPLPFLSYGAPPAMFASLIAIGLLQNVHMRNSEL